MKAKEYTKDSGGIQKKLLTSFSLYKSQDLE